MKAIDGINYMLNLSRDCLPLLLSDLSDADLLVRPVPGANHIAWQLGHIIASERDMVTKCLPGAPYPTLPAGFAEKHSKETSTKDTGFLTKAEYLDLFSKVRAATMDAASKLSESDFDRPTGWDYAPTVGAMLLLNGDHVMMHSGQWSVVRRKLGKPVLF